MTAEPLKVSGEAARRMGRRTLKYRLHENNGFLNSPYTSTGKNGLVERSTRVNQMLNYPSYISQGTLCFAYDKLFVKIIAASIVDSIVTFLREQKEGKIYS